MLSLVTFLLNPTHIVIPGGTKTSFSRGNKSCKPDCQQVLILRPSEGQLAVCGDESCPLEDTGESLPITRPSSDAT